MPRIPNNNIEMNIFFTHDTKPFHSLRFFSLSLSLFRTFHNRFATGIVLAHQFDRYLESLFSNLNTFASLSRWERIEWLSHRVILTTFHDTIIYKWVHISGNTPQSMKRSLCLSCRGFKFSEPTQLLMLTMFSCFFFFGDHYKIMEKEYFFQSRNIHIRFFLWLRNVSLFAIASLVSNLISLPDQVRKKN